MAAYVGRFAPSPTGPLHLGSLYTALASYLDARANNGRWLLRIEDIDPPREIPGAANTIIQQLAGHGLHWDGAVLYQSQRLSAYAEAVQALAHLSLTYACQCSRSRLLPMHGVYDGYCRTLDKTGESARVSSGAIRVCIESCRDIGWQDIFRHACHYDLAQLSGDFVIVRRDGLFAYQLAVSVDDAFQGVTHVVRGDDLLDSTPRQIFLLRQLKLPIPLYGHIAVINNSAGQKLSKQNRTPAITTATPGANLEWCLNKLGMPVPGDMTGAPVEELLAWAVHHWMPEHVPTGSISVDNG